MAKRLTTGERIRRYMEAHPDATPKKIAEDLGVNVTYVHTLRSSDKKRIAEGKPIRRVKRNYTKPSKDIKDMKLFTLPESISEMIEKAEEARKTMSITMEEPKHDPVNHPAHYKVGGIETIDFIEAKQLTYNLGNVIKYITRADHKGNKYEDLCKARWYLNRELSRYTEANNA